MSICTFWIKQNEQIDTKTFLDNSKRTECAAFRSQLGQVFLVYVGSFFELFFVQFSCWFFDRFLIVLGCQHGVFLEPKIYQNATYEFLMFIDFILVFPLLLRLGGSYVGSISVLFAHRFLHRFLVDLGVDFGALLGAFGGSKSIIFGIDFGMIFACRSKSGLRAPKSGPRAPKSAPRAPKRGPKGAKSGPRGAQERPRGAQERPQSTQWAAKRAKYVLCLALESRLAALYIYIYITQNIYVCIYACFE